MKIGTLVVLRHGPDIGGSDAVAVLTEAGKWEVRQTALGMSGWIGKKVLVLSSPIIRAMQTAEILKEVLAADMVELDQLKRDRLSFGASCKSEIQSEAAKDDGYSDVIVVTHHQLVNGVILAFKEEFPAIRFTNTRPPPYGHGFVVNIESGAVENI